MNIDLSKYAGQIVDPTQTEEYKALMRPVVEANRDWLESIGYDPDNNWELCEWMVWHAMKDD